MAKGWLFLGRNKQSKTEAVNVDNGALEVKTVGNIALVTINGVEYPVKYAIDDTDPENPVAVLAMVDAAPHNIANEGDVLEKGVPIIGKDLEGKAIIVALKKDGTVKTEEQSRGKVLYSIGDVGDRLDLPPGESHIIRIETLDYSKLGVFLRVGNTSGDVTIKGCTVDGSVEMTLPPVIQQTLISSSTYTNLNANGELDIMPGLEIAISNPSAQTTMRTRILVVGKP